MARRTTQIKAMGCKHVQKVLLEIGSEARLHINLHLPPWWQTIQQLRDSVHDIDETTNEWTKQNYKTKFTFIAGDMNIDMNKAMRDEMIDDRAMTLAECLQRRRIPLRPPGNIEDWTMQLKNKTTKTYGDIWTDKDHINDGARAEWWLRGDHRPTSIHINTEPAQVTKITPSKKSKMFAWMPAPARARPAEALGRMAA